MVCIYIYALEPMVCALEPMCVIIMDYDGLLITIIFVILDGSCVPG
jgi:hypothetical protein